MATQTVGGSPEDDLAAIREVIDTDLERRKIESRQRYSDAITAIRAAFSALSTELGGSVVLGQTNHRIEPDFGATTYFWRRSGGDVVLSTTCEAVEMGDELVIRLSSETVYRTPLSSPLLGDELRGVIRAWVLARLRGVLADPNALPVEAEYFGERKPFSRLADAAVAAAKIGKHILAVVYDPALPERGQLAYGLRTFLQNRKTRDTMDATFVTALVPLAQVREHTSILDGISMEESSWVVFDSALNAVEQRTIYANGSEGEKIMTGLADRFPLSFPSY
jgi:serine/threonine-protein kinase